ncbi:MAG: rhodanese-like domain-containing protein [Alkalispirochaeta sp.]
MAQTISVKPGDTASLEEAIAGAGDSGDLLLIDVRTPEEFRSGHIPTAINIDHRRIAEGAAEIDRDQRIVLYCRSGSRSRSAYRTLREMGFTDVVDFGGIIHWKGEIER